MTKLKIYVQKNKKLLVVLACKSYNFFHIMSSTSGTARNIKVGKENLDKIRYIYIQLI